MTAVTACGIGLLHVFYAELAHTVLEGGAGQTKKGGRPRRAGNYAVGFFQGFDDMAFFHIRQGSAAEEIGAVMGQRAEFWGGSEDRKRGGGATGLGVCMDIGRSRYGEAAAFLQHMLDGVRANLTMNAAMNDQAAHQVAQFTDVAGPRIVT